MKKIYALLLTLLLCLSMLSGCKDGETVPGNRETTETDSTPAGTEAEDAASDPAPVVFEPLDLDAASGDGPISSEAPEPKPRKENYCYVIK